MDTKRTLNKMYALLEDRFGDLKWWPAESDFEVVVGAVLTQNTSWKNVEKAIGNLKKRRLMDLCAMTAVSASVLSREIKPSGFHRVKTRRLKNVCDFIAGTCGGDICRLRRYSYGRIKEMLLSVNGIGPETADSIILYAIRKPVFVVDAYTKRIFSRHGIIDEGASYDEVQGLVQEAFLEELKELGQLHALLVETAKMFCRKRKPLCGKCPLSIILPKRQRGR
ncbi:MAG: hypothetical protein ABIG55_04130 [Candidatus Omnitrophota bacterium]|nr:hypothetical protein [Candidatus Omnitrophota bacterium]